MLHYFLPNPNDESDTLIPILKSRARDEYFMLRYNERLERELVRFDPRSGTSLGDPIPVPAEWAGEPVTVRLAESDWAHMQKLSADGDADARRSTEALLRTVLGGDVVHVTRDGRHVGTLAPRASKHGLCLVLSPVEGVAAEESAAIEAAAQS